MQQSTVDLIFLLFVFHLPKVSTYVLQSKNSCVGGWVDWFESSYKNCLWPSRASSNWKNINQMPKWQKEKLKRKNFFVFVRFKCTIKVVKPI